MTTAEYTAYIARYNSARSACLGPERADAVAKEATLHDEIIAECKRRGWIYFHGSMAHRSRRTLGEPDFTVLGDGGRVFFFEAKARNGKLSPEQSSMAAWAAKLGHTIHVVRSFLQFADLIREP